MVHLHTRCCSAVLYLYILLLVPILVAIGFQVLAALYLKSVGTVLTSCGGSAYPPCCEDYTRGIFYEIVFINVGYLIQSFVNEHYSGEVNDVTWEIFH